MGPLPLLDDNNVLCETTGGALRHDDAFWPPHGARLAHLQRIVKVRHLHGVKEMLSY
jgi:hypothetical protein